MEYLKTLTASVSTGAFPGEHGNFDSFWACDVVFPASFSSDCILFKMGSSEAAMAVILVDTASGSPKLRLRAGKGSVNVPSEDVVSVDVANIPNDGQLHTVCWDILASPDLDLSVRARIWIDGTLQGMDSKNILDNMWASNVPGSFGVHVGDSVVGVPTYPWPVTITSDLRYYKSQLGPSSAMEGGAMSQSIATSTYDGFTTIEYVQAEKTDAFFSCEAVIPSTFASSCMLFHYGKAINGLYVGVRTDGSIPILRYFVGKDGIGGPPAALMDIADFPQDGRWHNIAFDISIQKNGANKDRIRLWIDGILKGEVLYDLKNDKWCGIGDSGFGIAGMNSSVYESTTSWPAALGQLRYYGNDRGSLPARGAISLTDIASEYGITGPISLKSLYKKRQAETTGVFDRVEGSFFVGGGGSPLVPSSGNIGLRNFLGQRSRPPATIAQTVTVPPTMSDFVEEVEVDVFLRSLADVAMAPLTGEGWQFSDASFSTTASGISWWGRKTLTTPVVVEAITGVRHVSWTITGQSMEGGELVVFSATNMADNVVVELGKFELAATSTVYTLDLRSLTDFDLLSAQGFKFSVYTSIGLNDGIIVENINIKTSHLYACSGSSNRASYLSAYNVFKPDTSQWQGNDASYNLGHYTPLTDGYGRHLRPINGFNSQINGEVISLRLPFPLYVTSYLVSGLVIDLRLFGSTDGTTWDVIDNVTGLSGVFGEEHVLTPEANPSDKPYTMLAMVLARMADSAWDRGQMRRITYTGIKA